ncbi:hypothetical protein V8E52_012024 [Russula decolorans]
MLHIAQGLLAWKKTKRRTISAQEVAGKQGEERYQQRQQDDGARWSTPNGVYRRILRDLNAPPPRPSSTPSTTWSKAARVYPSSTLVEGLDISKCPTTIEDKYFNRKKGKGLVAKEPISEGQTVWKEDPLVIAPEWEIYDLQLASRTCAHCTTHLTNLHLASLILNCPTTSSTTSSAKDSPLLCIAQNPASVPLLTFARKHVWMALHALAQCTARLLLAHQQKQGRQWAGITSLDNEEDGMRKDWSVYCALADLGMEERVKGGRLHDVELDRATWQAAHRAFTEAFLAPPDTVQQKKLAKLLKRPLPKEVADALFTYEGFFHGLGRMSLSASRNSRGLYTLHSRMNHSCNPNVSVRHPDWRTALSRITVIGKCDIAVGEELIVTYVDPSQGVCERRSQLVAWGFGQCECERGFEEEREGFEGRSCGDERSDMADLEKELKAGLGVM